MPLRNHPNSLTLQQLTSLLTKAGGKTITPEMVEKDIRSGAPANGDGTVNLVQYAAWLAANCR